MNNDNLNLIASNLVVAFYSAVEPRPVFLGKDRRKREVPVEGLDMRNPSISTDEVYKVYRDFLKKLEHDSR